MTGRGDEHLYRVLRDGGIVAEMQTLIEIARYVFNGVEARAGRRFRNRR